MADRARTVLALLALLALPVLPAVAAAQTPALDPGSLLIGGGASFTSSGSDDVDERTTSLSVSPHVQYFLARGLAVGGDVSLARTSADDFTTTTYGIGPVATYYFVRDDGAAHPFLSAGVRLASVNAEFRGDETDYTTFQYRAAGGLLFLLSESVGVNAQLFYEWQRLEMDRVDLDSDEFGLALGVSAFLF